MNRKSVKKTTYLHNENDEKDIQREISIVVDPIKWF